MRLLAELGMDKKADLRAFTDAYPMRLSHDAANALAYLQGGAADELTCQANLNVWQDWALLPRNQAGGQQTLNLQPWQLPELLSIVVVEGAEAPTNLRALPNPFAQANAVAVPVVPELC